MKIPKNDATISTGKKEVKLTNLGKLFWKKNVDFAEIGDLWKPILGKKRFNLAVFSK